ncbi:hypothetical protein E2C01_042803 [Portunus trituberculatus]|uniref:Uncharacterized protein n=1 Tax=Portunus trituberculatus TaxID=210409 RepID=A0A5B7FUJ6_PORTR|nr:hypothetical protein [Portunus trituberculatus]
MMRIMKAIHKRVPCDISQEHLTNLDEVPEEITRACYSLKTNTVVSFRPNISSGI